MNKSYNIQMPFKIQISFKNMTLLVFAFAFGLLPSYLYADEKIDNSRKWSTYGQALYLKDKTYEAKTAFENAIRWHDGNAGAWQGLGNVQVKLGDRAAALEAYQKSLQLRPDNGTLRKYVEELNASPDESGSQVAAVDDDLEDSIEEARQALANREFDYALEQFKALEKNRRDHAGIYNGLGEAFYGLGRMGEARTAYERSLALNKNQPDIQAFVDAHLSRPGEDVLAAGQGKDWLPSLARSAVLPGWGQYRNGQGNKAVVLGLSVLALGGGVAYTYIQADNAYKDYSALGAGTPNQDFDDAFGRVENLSRVNHVLYVIFSTTYLYNLVDSIWYAPGLKNVEVLARVGGQGTAVAGLSVKF